MSTTSIDFWNNVATTTGTIIQDSFPLLYLLLGTFFAILFAGSIIWALSKGVRYASKGR